MKRLRIWIAIAKFFGALLLLVAAYLQITVISAYSSMEENWAHYSLETRLDLIWHAQALPEAERAKYMENNNERFYSSGIQALKTKSQAYPADTMYLRLFILGTVLFVLGELWGAVEAANAANERHP